VRFLYPSRDQVKQILAKKRYFQCTETGLRSRNLIAMVCHMSVEFIPAEHVRATLQRIGQARRRASDACPPVASADATYWERFFEANAAATLAEVDSVKLPDGFVVRYRCYGQRGQDVLLRPFVARASTDVSQIRRLLDWHPPPDSMKEQERHQPTRDVELLYRYFEFEGTAVALFDYWMVMQEIWASSWWTHSQVIASIEEFSNIVAPEGWRTVHPVEHGEPAVVRSGDAARLAALVRSPLRQFEVSLQQIDIGPDHSLRYAAPIVVASGPRGYLA